MMRSLVIVDDPCPELIIKPAIPHRFFQHRIKLIVSLFILIAASPFCRPVLAQSHRPSIHYIVSIPHPSGHTYHVELQTSGWNLDTLQFKMPKWMPGYYQIMNYANNIENISADNSRGNAIPLTKINNNTWRISGIKNKAFTLHYDIKTHRQFVATSYVDARHAYLIPESSFLYPDGFLNLPVSVKIVLNPKWKNIATGLDKVTGKQHEFTASDFDFLYDCPLLIGNLEELPSFKVKGIVHRFIGYDIGTFNHTEFINNLKKVVSAAVSVIGVIPYKQYTFIAIGPGRGGIEHLDNATVSFNGNELNTRKGSNTMMNFLAHEYFHNYNVKRIRPVELGPFDYDHADKTYQLWISEGLTVYYEYLAVKRAGLINDSTLLSDFDQNINTYENNPGRFYQSLIQASYNTWEDGPFGNQGKDAGKAISYYQKGPIVGLLLDFAIRNATHNRKSLDDVMRLLYWKYYKKLRRGFTGAEFQQACEAVAGKSLTPLFEYVNTTKKMDYNTYLNMGGLNLDLLSNSSGNSRKKYRLHRIANPDSLQIAIFNSWSGGN